MSCCARCTKPIAGDKHKVSRFTYGDCCIKKVVEENPGSKVKTNAK